MKKQKVMVTLLMIISLATVFTGCDIQSSKDEDALLPILGTVEVKNITSTSATVNVVIVSNSGSTISEQGIEIELTKIKDVALTESNFTVVVNSLTPNKSYTVKAYATNVSGTAYSKEVSFKTNPPLPTIKDIDGNEYNVVVIGTQTWTVQDLRVTHYRDGSSIPNVTGDITWSNLTSGARCYYNNDGVKSRTSLYNWYAASSSKGIAPDGWHVPTEADWHLIQHYLNPGVADKMKETGAAHWPAPNTYSTNTSGFTAIPTGNRDMYGSFVNMNQKAQWFQNNNQAALIIRATDYPELEGAYVVDKTEGSAIRLVKDD